VLLLLPPLTETRNAEASTRSAARQTLDGENSWGRGKTTGRRRAAWNGLQICSESTSRDSMWTGALADRVGKRNRGLDAKPSIGGKV
jgi:hypothetical protein